MLSIPLYDAIYAKVTGTAGIISAFPANSPFPASFYQDIAPEGAPLPFLVASTIAAPQVLKYGPGVQRVEVSMQFAAYGNGKFATLTALKAFTDVFDDLTLTLGSGHNVNTSRLNDPLPRFESRDAAGNEVWQAVVEYEFVIAP